MGIPLSDGHERMKMSQMRQLKRAKIIAMILSALVTKFRCQASEEASFHWDLPISIQPRNTIQPCLSKLLASEKQVLGCDKDSFADTFEVAKLALEVERGGSGQDNTITFTRRKIMDSREVLDCKSSQVSRSNKVANERGGMFNEAASLAAGDFSYVDYRGRLDGSRKLSHSPVVYQYYGRSRMRGNPSDAIHFILLGPNVDHWRSLGHVLASRGFNTIACERVESDEPGADIDRGEDSPNLVIEIMDALKWNRAILVGCDDESILAMETAMMLSPERVVGLVLAGDLTGVNKIASASGVHEIDNFLQRVLNCPFLIVWDGDAPSIVPGSSAHNALEADTTNRCLILGGGSAPHRLKPEQFAWVLTRFVEERLEISFKKPEVVKRNPLRKNATSVSGAAEGLLRALNLPFGIDTLVSPEGRLLLGRAVAAGIFYITAMRVVLIQYGILRSGLMAIKSKYDSIDAITKKGFQAVGAFFINFGYIPRLFTLKRASDEDEDERESGTIVLSDQSAQGDFKLNAGEDENSNCESTGNTEKNGALEVEEESEKVDDEKLDSENSAPKESERPRFKPFFFLDNVVT